MALLLVLLMGISAPGRAFSWPWSQPAEETFVQDAPEPTIAPTPTPDPVEPRQTDETALLRVLLKSLESPVALGITLTGPYSIENDSGFRFAANTDLSVAVEGENLYLACGGLTLNMGTSLTLTRAASDNPRAGLVIHETGRENVYSGDLTLSAVEGAIQPVVTLDVEDYLYGVVPYEMSDSFPIEALKAQAVAARTYAMSRKSGAGSRAYDVVDTTADQVFRGLDPDTENAIAAVDATRGVVGFYNNTYATCYFSASNGGQTAMPDQIWGYSGDYGYLDVRDDPYDLANPSSEGQAAEHPPPTAARCPPAGQGPQKRPGGADGGARRKRGARRHRHRARAGRDARRADVRRGQPHVQPPAGRDNAGAREAVYPTHARGGRPVLRHLPPDTVVLEQP
jgi:hypothetical protein